MKMTSKLFLSALTLGTTAVVALAQDAPRDGGRQRGGGDRGGFNTEEFRKRMNDRLKEALKATDEEWAVLQPLIEKVQTKQRETMTSRFGGMFGGRGPGGGGGGGGGGGDRGAGAGGNTGGGAGGGGDRGGDRGGSPESQALRTALESDSTSAEDLKAKLTAVREARKKSAAELEAARTDLAKVLSVRQEAVLVSMGVLD
jgi:hypothetical protein